MAEHTAGYHDRSEVPASWLVYADISMGHYQMSRTRRIKPTKEMEFGTQVHLGIQSLIEASNDYRDTYIAKPEGMDRRTNIGKERYAEFERECVGKTIVSQDDWDRAERICYSFLSCDDPMIRLVRESSGINEVPVIWTNEVSDLACRCKPDRLIEVSDGETNEWLASEFPELFNPIHNRICVDWKTMGNFTPRDFGYRLRGKPERGFGYGLAASHYLEGTKADAFLWVVLETNEPFTVAWFLMKPETHRFYDKRRIELLRRIAVCERMNDWPGITITKEERML